jgi:hypothetical protein
MAFRLSIHLPILPPPPPDGLAVGRTYLAGVAELVDAADSKSAMGNHVSVRLRPPAPIFHSKRFDRLKEKIQKTLMTDAPAETKPALRILR